MEQMKEKILGKKLAYILRHNPESINSRIDNYGWMNVQDLLNNGWSITDLEDIVDSDDKGRYEFSKDKSKIRALQGHSVPGINANFDNYTGSIVYHGTQKSNINNIFEKGLLKGSRNYVHLSLDIETARKVALRRGPDIVILKVDISNLDNILISKNGVVLADYVDPSRISIIDETLL